MRAEDLKRWILEANQIEKPVTHRWENMVRLIHLAFAEGELTEELTWATMLLLPKGKGEYRGIGLVEVARKVCTVVLELRLKKGVELHYSLHGFWEGIGMGTDTPRLPT